MRVTTRTVSSLILSALVLLGTAATVAGPAQVGGDLDERVVTADGLWSADAQSVIWD